MRENTRKYRGAGLLAAAAPIMVVTLVFLISGISPLGERLLLCSANAEWFERLCEFHGTLSSGSQGSLFYSFSRGAGTDFYRSFASGLCSPFILLTGFFPQAVLAETLSFITMLRAACAGYFSYLMLSQVCLSSDGVSQNRLSAAVFAAAYGSGSAVLLSFLAPQYADAVVFFPLVGAGLGLICRRGSGVLALVGMTLSLICAPTLWPMLVGFSVVWFSMMQAITSRCPHPHPLLRRSVVENAAVLLFCIAIAFGVSAAVLIPVFSASAELGALIVPMENVDTAKPLDALAGLLPALRPFGEDAGGAIFPVCSTTTLALLLIPVYFFDSRRGLLERQIPVFAIVGGLLCIVIPAFGMLFAAFAEPTGVLVGGGFIIAALSAAAAARTFAADTPISMYLPFTDNLRSARGRSGARVGSVLLAWALLVVMLVVTLFSNGGFDIGTVVITTVFVTAFAALAITALSGGGRRVGAYILALLLVCGECVYAGASTLSSDGLGLITADSFTQSYNHDATMRLPMTEDGRFFRIRGENVGGTNRFDQHCDYPEATRQLLSVLGISENGGHTPVTDALFGVQFVAGSQPTGSYTQVGDGESISVWRAANTLPLAFVASSEVLALNVYSANPFEAQNQLMTAIAGQERAVFADVSVADRFGTGCFISDDDAGTHIIRNEQGACVTYNLTIPADAHLYMQLADSAHTPARITVGGRELEPTTLGSVTLLGSFSRGATVNITVSVDADRVDLGGAYFALLDRTYCEAAIAELCERQTFEAVKVSGGVCRATVNLGEGQLLLTTLPWQEGWSATVDGRAVDTVCAGGAFVAVNAGAGTHTVTLTYTPPELYVSVIVSLVSLLCALVFIAATEAIRRRRENTAMMTPVPSPMPMQDYPPMPRQSLPPLPPEPDEDIYEEVFEEDPNEGLIPEMVVGHDELYDEYGYTEDDEDDFYN